MTVAAVRPIKSPARAPALQLSLVIPAFNECESILSAIAEARTALSALTDDFEVIVVDDGSSDGTADLVAGEAARDARIRLARHERNRGYGAALRSGFTAATFDLVAFTDADCQFDLGELARLLPLTRTHDVVCGRWLARQDTPLRRFLSRGYNALVGLLLDLPVRDVDCALKVFHRSRLLRILPQSDGFFANTEMLVAARRQRLAVAEIGVRHRPRRGGASKVSLGDVPRTLAVLLPFWWRQVRGR